MGPTGNVLVVDDDARNREIMGKLLGVHGHQAGFASNGVEALARVRDELPDVVMLDLDMPRLDGYGVIDALRSDPATETLPILVVTGHSARHVKIRALAVGADDFLVRPFDAYELLIRLRNLVREKRLRDEIARRTRAECLERMESAQRLESIGKLAGGIAHDFNNVLSVIGTYTELAARSIPDEHPACDDLAEVKAASRSAGALVRQLLHIARGSSEGDDGESDLIEVARRVSRMIDRAFGARITLQAQFGAAAARVPIDAGQLEQVLLNLAVNARDAMPDGGTLRFEVAPDGASDQATVELVVADTGCGMSSDVMERAFEPFYTTKRHAGGTGLGLSTCRGIVERAGGRMHCDSSPGVGTQISIVLPRSQEDGG